MSGCEYNLYSIEDLSTEFYDFLHLEIVNIYSIIKCFCCKYDSEGL